MGSFKGLKKAQKWKICHIFPFFGKIRSRNMSAWLLITRNGFSVQKNIKKISVHVTHSHKMVKLATKTNQSAIQFEKNVEYYGILWCTTMHYNALRRTTVHYSSQTCTMVHKQALQCTNMHYSTQICTMAYKHALRCTNTHYVAQQCTLAHYDALQHIMGYYHILWLTKATVVYYGLLQHTVAYFDVL